MNQYESKKEEGCVLHQMNHQNEHSDASPGSVNKDNIVISVRKAGLHMGTKLQGPSQGNWHGHFEDSDFYNLTCYLNLDKTAFLPTFSALMDNQTP